MICHQFPVPHLEDMFNCASSAKAYSKNELQSGNLQLCICHGNEWKTTVKVREALFEWG